MPLYNIHKTVKVGGKYHYPGNAPIELQEINKSYIDRKFVSLSGAVPHEVKTTPPTPPGKDKK